MPVSILGDFKPPKDAIRIEEEYRRAIRRNTRKIIVLDDDPTGIQTIHDIPVYTDWSEESILNGFKEESGMFFILTNSRSFPAEKTANVHHTIANSIVEVSKRRKMDFILISRSDSTLRGHYPLETQILKDALEDGLGINIDGEILCPFFQEGGRFTINNVHYVQNGKSIIPAGKTEFAFCT